MRKPYFTRKNFIALSLAFFYSIVLIYVGLCLDGAHAVISKKNVILSIAKGLAFEEITPGIAGFTLLVLVAIYITAFVGIFLYERRYAIVNGKKKYGFKMIMTYVLTFLACAVLSVGVGYFIQNPKDAENLGKVFTFLGQSLILGTILYAIVVIVVGAILMLVVNFILVDKPFKFFEQKDLPVLDDEVEELSDVTMNFDENPELGAGGAGGEGGAGGAGGGAGGGGGVVENSEQLDDRIRVFPGLSKIDAEYDGFAIDKIETDNVSLAELATGFRNYLAKDEGLYFEEDVIRYFIAAFGTSHFMILEGLSGTGKSSLPRYFGKYIGANVLFVPVQATWRDKSSLLGYFNDFSKTYTETDFLLTLYEGNYNPDRVSLYVLDEMNISRVEYYFADFLSVLEYPEDEWKMKILTLPYDFIPPAKLDDGYITIKNNSYFVGTANKDDSTFTITDKVYDRAITIDFEERNEAFEVNDETKKVNISSSYLHSLYEEALADDKNRLNKDDMAKFKKITDYINEEFDITFGNRILNQIEHIVPIFVACGGAKEAAFDFLLSRKVISKIEGRFEDYVKGALKGLLDLLAATYGAGVMKYSEKTINSFIRRL